MNAMTGNSKGCACGAQDCASQCCELDCLVRPNFFCGQMLTDADLAAMVTWTRSRLALARYRDGWGIACGLDVSCQAPEGGAACCTTTAAATGPALYVNPGYARDCCGNDLVVCAPLRVDLTAVCKPPDDPCQPPPAPVPPPPSAPPADAWPVDCLHPPVGELFAVQLFLRYREDLAQGQRAMFRGPCADDGPCQYARVLEQPCVHLEPVALRPAADPVNDAARWMQAFRTRLAGHIATLRTAALAGAGALLQQVRRNPPYQFCYLDDALCCLLAAETPTVPTAPGDLLRTCTLLLADWLQRALRCPCPDCAPDNGVALGRVILRRRLVDRVFQYRVVIVEQGTAWRRALRLDPCRPLDPQVIDLAPYLWQERGALDGLRQRGIAVNPVTLDATDSNQLASQMDSFTNLALTAAPGANVSAVLAFDVAGVTRIAFFLNG